MDNAAAIITAVGVFIVTVGGFYLQLRAIHKNVNSNMAKQNERIEELNKTISDLVRDREAEKRRQGKASRARASRRRATVKRGGKR